MEWLNVTAEYGLAGLLAGSFLSATLLPGGAVLVVGGNDASGPVLEAELFNPASGQWSSAGVLSVAPVKH